MIGDTWFDSSLTSEVSSGLWRYLWDKAVTRVRSKNACRTGAKTQPWFSAVWKIPVPKLCIHPLHCIYKLSVFHHRVHNWWIVNFINVGSAFCRFTSCQTMIHRVLFDPYAWFSVKFSAFRMQFQPTPQRPMGVRGAPNCNLIHRFTMWCSIKHSTPCTFIDLESHMHFEIIIVQQQNGQLNSPNADYLKYEMCLLKDAMALPHISHSQFGSVCINLCNWLLGDLGSVGACTNTFI